MNRTKAGAIMTLKRKQKMILIGDSITEDNRFADPDGLGRGYVRLIHDYLLARRPDLDLTIQNKGVSGNRVVDLYERWRRDVLDEQPDWVSISIGVNDAWRQLSSPDERQVYPDEFEEIYRKILRMTREEINAGLIIMGPTIIVEDSQSEGNRILQDYVRLTKQLSEEFAAIHIPMNDIFNRYIYENPAYSLTVDGVHMNPLGRMLMATSWLECIGM